MRIFADRVAQIACNVWHRLLAAKWTHCGGRTVLLVPILIQVRTAVVVGVLADELEIVFEIVMEGCNVGSGDAGIGGIVAGVLACCVGVRPLESRVVAAKNLVLVTQQFLAEARRGDTQIRIFDKCWAESNEAAKLTGNLVGIGIAERITLV